MTSYDGGSSGQMVHEMAVAVIDDVEDVEAFANLAQAARVPFDYELRERIG